MLASNSFDKIRMTRYRPKCRYVETLDPVIPKIFESIIVDPLNLVQAKCIVKQLADNIRRGHPCPIVFSMAVPSSATKEESML